MQLNECVNHSGLVARIDNVEGWQKEHMDDDHKDIWEAIKGLREDMKQIFNRPPVWCTAVIALLSGLLGSAVTVAIYAISH